MTKKRGIFSVVLAFCLPLMTFCAKTTLDYVWKDPHYQGGKFNKVLVVGVAQNQANRILFENKFVAELKNYGTDAISSYTIISSAEKLDKATVKSEIKTLEVDAVVVTKLMNIEQKKTYSRVVNPSQTQPRLQRGGWVDYSTDYETAKDRGSYYKYEVVGLETKIYDAQTDKLIWSGWTDTVLEDSVEVAIGSLIKTITKSLSDNQLI